MRTTLSLDDDIFFAAKALAEHERKTIGQVVSDLARKSLADRPRFKTRNGIPLLVRAPGPRVVITMELVNALRDEAS